ncbi:TPA: HlyD family efflux transporter periplasmic adaptor subunit, partial [Escherichia coli]|nr:HlyD family efflux transporter periplasmic adaptor subunit [Escherichia coli]
KEVSAAILQANEEYELLLKTFRRDTLEQLNQTKETINQLNHDFEKIKEREQALNIKSPVDGVVQQVTTFTEGGVVTTAQSLMVIVPENEKLSAKIMIANKDIGFIRVGQPVIIKIEAFPYTKYGYIHGKVKTVSSESIEDKEKGLYFDGYITLEQSSINIDGKDVSLTSGMSI